MKKQSPILSFALCLLFISVITGSNAQSKKSKGSKSDVTVSRTISAGQYSSDGRRMVVVTVTIKKNAYKGPGRIVETFSSDLQATVVSSNSAIFQSGSGKAEFVWNNISEDRQISVSYALQAPASASESQTVSGQFMYQNQSFPIDAQAFSLKSTGTAAQATPTGTTTLDDIYYTVTGSYPQGSVTSAASVPDQTTTSPNEVAAAPAQPVQQTAATPTPVADQQAASASSAPPVQQTAAPVSDQQTAGTTTGQAQQVASAPPVQQSPAATEDTKTMAEPPAQANIPSAAAAKDDHSNNNLTSDAGGDMTPAMAAGSNFAPEGLIYRVQIIVVGGRTRLRRFYRRYRITDEVYYDPSEGVPVRVMVGNYNDYTAAKARCLELRGRGITDAFVVSYYMGKRITTAEAATKK